MSIQINEMNGESNNESISHYYSDDFESDSEDEIVPRKEEKRLLKTKRKDSQVGRSVSDTQAVLQRNKLKRSSFDRPLPLKRSFNQNEESYVTQRLLSARKHKITELRNEIRNLERQLKEVSDENRFLKQLHIRQEKELMKLDTAKSELPNIMRSHNQELLALRKQLRRQKEKNREVVEKLKAKEMEILHMKDDLNILNSICQQKDLKERDELQKKIESLEQQLLFQTTSSQEYLRKLELANKLHRQEIAAEKVRFKQTKNKVDQLEHRCEELNALLKDRELKLERSFIYSKHKRNSTKDVKSVESFIPYVQENSSSPLPSACTEINTDDNFSIVDEQHNSSEDHVNGIQNDDYWSQLAEGERHKAISQGEQLLQNMSKQVLSDNTLTTDDGKITSNEVENDDNLKESETSFPIKSASAESLGNVEALKTVNDRSYSSLALTSNQSDENLSKENVILSYSSLSKSVSLFTKDTLNHEQEDNDDLEGNFLHSLFNRKTTIDHHQLNEKSEMIVINSEQFSLNSILTEKIDSTTDDIKVDSDHFPYRSSPNKTQDDTYSWLPDIFQESVNLH